MQQPDKLTVTIDGNGLAAQNGGTEVTDQTLKEKLREMKYPDRYICKGGRIEFVNNSGEDITIVIPLRDDYQVLDRQFIDMSKDDDPKTFEVLTGEKAVYRYAVLLKNRDEFAKGGSTPRVMIEPPDDSPMPPLR